MKRTRAQITVRRMMIAVLLVGVATWMVIRGERRRAYYREAAFVYWSSSMGPGARVAEPMRSRHEQLWRKYWWAERFPWLPVWPSPPEGASRRAV